MNRYRFFFSVMAMIIINMASLPFTPTSNYSKKNSQEDMLVLTSDEPIKYTPELHPSYVIRECKMEIETSDIHIHIKYPQIVFSNFQELNIEKEKKINKLLTPQYIETFFDMVGQDIIINDTGQLEYDCAPYTYELGMDNTYTLGWANDNLINLYIRSISYSRNSNWSYGALLIDTKSGERIIAKDFFDLDVFYSFIVNNAFETNNIDFDIQLYFKNIDKEDLKNYLDHIFINQNGKIEIILIYGEGPETVIYADIDKVMDMIKPEYQKLLLELESKKFVTLRSQ